MIEELIRIEHGSFRHGETEYAIDLSISGGDCIGIYVDNHRSSGTACMEIFRGRTDFTGGRAFCRGIRTGRQEMSRWICDNTVVIDRHRFDTKELTAIDFVTALGPSISRQMVQTPEAARIRDRMRMTFPWETRLVDLSMPDYYRLAAFRAWLSGRKILVLDRITEILRIEDLRGFMQCAGILLEQGMALVLLDLDESFMFRYASRIDIMKNCRLCYRLFPEEYGKKLYDILGWQPGAGQRPALRTGSAAEFRPLRRPRHTSDGGPGEPCLRVSNLTFGTLATMNFELRGGEIGLTRDEDYRTGSFIRDCILGKREWDAGGIWLEGQPLKKKDLKRKLGSRIGLQIEMPDRPGGILFDNLTALENLTGSLIPKAGKHLVNAGMVNSVLDVASEWFDRQDLLKPVSEWPMPERLRLAYYKWYLINPGLLICLFPFLGQESNHHEMIVDLLVLCAKRGMAVWIISSGIDMICEKAANREFHERIRHLDGKTQNDIGAARM
ncbi:MAG: hypothetical protein E7238_05985 [Sarcina sp.]|nr:hypothetical protein [Sarcina sp.]